MLTLLPHHWHGIYLLYAALVSFPPPTCQKTDHSLVLLHAAYLIDGFHWTLTACNSFKTSTACNSQRNSVLSLFMCACVCVCGVHLLASVHVYVCVCTSVSPPMHGVHQQGKSVTVQRGFELLIQTCQSSLHSVGLREWLLVNQWHTQCSNRVVSDTHTNSLEPAPIQLDCKLL